MTDTDRLAKHAEALLNDEMLNGAFLAVRESLVRNIELASLDSPLRADLQLGLQMLRQVKMKIEEELQTHLLEKHDEEHNRQ